MSAIVPDSDPIGASARSQAYDLDALAAGYTVRQARMNRVAVVGFLSALSATAAFVVERGGMALPTGLASVAVGAFAADFLTGLVHWGCDTWGSPSTRWVGQTFIRPFREHHLDPRAMTRHDWAETAGESCLAGAPAMAALALLTPDDGSGLAAALHLTAVVTVTGAMAANQVHKWAHMETGRVPRLVRYLQRARLILSPAHHAQHHAAPHLHAYCILGGWLDRPLDRLGFWRALERLATRATGGAPRSDGL